MNKPFMTYKEENEQLTARVRELEEELDAAYKAVDDNWVSHQQLVASQAYAEQLLEALEKLATIANQYAGHYPYQVATIVDAALSTPTDTSALDAYVAKRLHDMACDKGLLRIQVEELTRQRDLAVEALEAMAQDGWLLCGPEGLSDAQKKVCEALSTIKESEGK